LVARIVKHASRNDTTHRIAIANAASIRIVRKYVLINDIVAIYLDFVTLTIKPFSTN